MTTGWFILFPIFTKTKFIKVLNKEVEKFGGDVLLTREDSLEQVQKQVDVWTETALQVFNRHKPNDSINNPNQEKLEEMIQVRWVFNIHEFI